MSSFPKFLKHYDPSWPVIFPTCFTFLSKLHWSLITGAVTSLARMQNHPTQQNRNCSGPSVLRLLVAKHLKLSSRRRLPPCPNFPYLTHSGMISSLTRQPWQAFSWPKKYSQNCLTREIQPAIWKTNGLWRADWRTARVLMESLQYEGFEKKCLNIFEMYCEFEGYLVAVIWTSIRYLRRCKAKVNFLR